MERYTLAELEALPTISAGQTDDLKIETDTRRVWLARTGVADGEAYDNRVTIEEYDGKRWNITESYEAQ